MNGTERQEADEEGKWGGWRMPWFSQHQNSVLRMRDAKSVHAITPSSDPLILVILRERDKSSERVSGWQNNWTSILQKAKSEKLWSFWSTKTGLNEFYHHYWLLIHIVWTLSSREEKMLKAWQKTFGIVSWQNGMISDFIVKCVHFLW